MKGTVPKSSIIFSTEIIGCNKISAFCLKIVTISMWTLKSFSCFVFDFLQNLTRCVGNLVNKNKTDPLRAVNILMRKGMGHTMVSAT